MVILRNCSPERTGDRQEIQRILWTRNCRLYRRGNRRWVSRTGKRSCFVFVRAYWEEHWVSQRSANTVNLEAYNFADSRRMNVALTRAKQTLLVVGHTEALRKHNIWKDLVEDAEERGKLKSPPDFPRQLPLPNQSVNQVIRRLHSHSLAGCDCQFLEGRSWTIRQPSLFNSGIAILPSQIGPAEQHSFKAKDGCSA